MKGNREMNQRQKMKRLKREKQFYVLAFRLACMEIERLSDMLAAHQNFTPIEIDKKFGIMDSDGNIIREPQKE